MKILAYLSFTLLSIIIQFAVMDYIQANIKEYNNNVDLNGTSLKKRFSDILKDYNDKPYALYFRSNMNKEKNMKMVVSTTVYNNITMSTTDSKTETTTSVYDILLYDENTSLSDIPTSEVPYTTTETDNITELSIFTNNRTTVKPTLKPKRKTFKKGCYCNLLYHVCDINCCCDEDCSEEEFKLFDCTEKGRILLHDHLACTSDGVERSNINSLFCIVKTNIPEKRITKDIKYDPREINVMTGKALKWHDFLKPHISIVMTPKLSTIGDPVWLLRNGSIFYLDLPLATVNNYCNGRGTVLFLNNRQTQCMVALQDLEMFQIVKNIEETIVISVTDKSNTTNLVLNCSNVYCTNWTIIICNETACNNYNKSLHEPTCTEIVCTNVATKIKYSFIYFEHKIINATIYLYTHNISLKVPYLMQSVAVEFYIANNYSNEKPLELSGNPGYLKSFPIICSYKTANYTSNFFNKSRNFIAYPENKKGLCVLTNLTYKKIVFGENKRNNCKYVHKENILKNATDTCIQIQKNIRALLGISQKAVISPFGNPYNLNDNEWVTLNMDETQNLPLYGEHKPETATISCYNIITKVTYIFGFVDISEFSYRENNKILTAVVSESTQNLTFDIDTISVVVAVESNFVDISKVPMTEYAGTPQLNIHLPKDFFFPFPSNKCYRHYVCNYAYSILVFVLTFISK